MVVFLASCTSTSEKVDPAACGPLKSFHIIAHGWHAGVIVDATDIVRRVPELGPRLDGAQLVELGWGDAEFYRDPNPTAAMALRAIMYPTTTVIQVLPIAHADPRLRFPDRTIKTLEVPAEGYERLLDHLAASFIRGPEGHLVALDPGPYTDSGFYQATGTFHAFNTCNTRVASAVAATGYPLGTAGVLTVHDLLAELEEGASPPCFVGR